jgi:hypothetical protein
MVCLLRLNPVTPLTAAFSRVMFEPMVLNVDAGSAVFQWFGT